jgi:hypothetical protein
MATKYGEIKYGTHIYGNLPPAIQIIVDGADDSERVMRKSFVIRDVIDQIKTVNFEVK